MTKEEQEKLKQRQATLDALWQKSLIPKAPEHLTGIDLKLFNAAAKKVKILQHPDLGGWYADNSSLTPEEYLALYGSMPAVQVTQEMLDTGYFPEPTTLAKGLAATRLKLVKELWNLGNRSASFEMKAIKNALDQYLAIKQEDALAALKGRLMRVGRAKDADGLLSKLVAKAVKQCKAQDVKPTHRAVMELLKAMPQVDEIDDSDAGINQWSVWLKGIDESKTGKTVANLLTKSTKKLQ